MNRITHQPNQIFLPLITLFAGLLSGLVPLSIHAHELKREFPVDRRPNLDFIQEEGAGFISGSGGKGYEWHFYKNYSYACGRKGFHTFLVANPTITNSDTGTREQKRETLPLLKLVKKL